MVALDQKAISDLSDKQKQVLNLLILHMTSKEMSRKIGISPHTVDQHIETVKRKLGAVSRNDLAQTYQQYVLTCQHATYEESRIVIPAVSFQELDPDDSERLLIHPEPDRIHKTDPGWVTREFQIAPELFGEKFGILSKLGAVAAISFLIVATILGGIVILQEISHLFARHP